VSSPNQAITELSLTGNQLSGETKFRASEERKYYINMSINANERPLATSDQVPTGLTIGAEGLLRGDRSSDCTAVSQPVTEKPLKKPVLSICISLKNRSRIIHKERELLLFPNCIKSISDAAEKLTSLGLIEVLVADFNSSDWPLESWIQSAAGALEIRVVNVDGDYSKGLGLNLAARHSRGDTLLLCDADMLIDEHFLRLCIKNLDPGIAQFPVIRLLDEDGSKAEWQYFGYGKACLSKKLYMSLGGVPEFRSWGGEDNIFYDWVSRRVPVLRDALPGLLHQWHPERCRHENYVLPEKTDYTNFVRDNCALQKVPIFKSLFGEHPHWQGRVLLLVGGRMTRPGVDYGFYEYSEGKYLRLYWDSWEPEELQWNSTSRVFFCSHNGFTLREEVII
jgi:glycosyltransferase involved in cell wall biosynthesis